MPAWLYIHDLAPAAQVDAQNLPSGSIQQLNQLTSDC